MPHSLPAAVALARGWPDLKVEIAGVTPEHLQFARDTTARMGDARVTYRLLGPDWLRRLGPKAPILAANLAYFAGFDAVVTPERTSALLARLGPRAPLLVYTQHGAGDRAGPFEPRLGVFDLVFAAGAKQRDRMVSEGLVRPENCAVVGYPKFELADALAADPPRLFETERPTVLYNPHFDRRLSSWPLWGRRVLEAFASQDRYSLIFAPHMRMFEGAAWRGRRLLAPFEGAANIHIDLGGPALVDMTYTELADVYLGDASSQVYEFLRRPRPCLFLNAHRADWRGRESYRHWRFGPVVNSAEGLIDAVDAARRDHRLFSAEQKSGFDYTFDLAGGRAAHRAADAIAARLLGRVQAHAAE